MPTPTISVKISHSIDNATMPSRRKRKYTLEHAVEVDKDPNIKNTNVSTFNYKHNVINGLKNGQKSEHIENKLKDDSKNVKKKTDKKISFFALFHYLSKIDVILISIAIFSNIIVGAAIPGNVLIFGEVINEFVKYENITKRNHTVDSIYNTVVKGYVPFSCLIAGSTLIFGFIQMFIWQLISIKQKRLLRDKLFDKILRMHISWFDSNNTGFLSNQLFEQINQIVDGIGPKLSTFIQYTFQFITGIIIGFIISWKLALVLLSLAPPLIIMMVILVKITKKMSLKEISAYGSANCIAEESLSAIRIVTAFGKQSKHLTDYERNLKSSTKVSLKRNIVNGITSGMQTFIMFGTLALPFWYGNKLVTDGEINGGEMITVIFSVLLATFGLGIALPSLEQIGIALSAAYTVFNLIEMKSDIDYKSKEGEILGNIDGRISMENVNFTYPCRPDVQIFSNLTLNIQPKQTVAFVGHSGCGKSTVAQLLLKLYTSNSGTIKIDNIDTNLINTHSLRSNIGIVSQEPSLFSTSIRKNISLGKPNATEEEIIEAAKLANAHKFIMALPDGYDTLVGTRGSQMSGGQKQRIALARSLIGKPPILILDEATSALDRKNEIIVQQALDRACKGRTTIIIAHRLSTIINADCILVFENGRICEIGKHDELLLNNGVNTGVYADLVNRQLSSLGDNEKTNMNNVCKTDSEMDLIVCEEKMDEEGERKQDHHSYEINVSGVDDDKQSSVHSIVRRLSKQKEEVEKAIKYSVVKRLLDMNSNEKCILIAGCVLSIFHGCVMPCFALVLSQIMDNFATLDAETQKEYMNLLSAAFCLLASLNGSLLAASFILLGKASQRLIERLRIKTFQHLLYKEISFFDKRKNDVGVLTTLLSEDASSVKGVSGDFLQTIFYSTATVLSALSISFYFCWQLALIGIAAAPLSIVNGMVQSFLHRKSFEAKHKIVTEDNVALSAESIATETLNEMKTVTMLCRQKFFLERFTSTTKTDYFKERKEILIFSIVYALSISIQFFAFAAMIGLGSYLVEKGENTFADIFRVYLAMNVCATSLGRTVGMNMGYLKGKKAAKKIFEILNSKSNIDAKQSTSGVFLPDNAQGKISFKDIRFSYPTRIRSNVLNDFNLGIDPGKTIALVGSSGAGKSTIASLIERFYDCENGTIEIDGINIKSINIFNLRSRISIVTQEPILFANSIRENIAYGAIDSVDDEQIIEAAKSANIHNFIAELPNKYDTAVGAKGSQLSGGQKQRIAIARALIRKPLILLLDEATSALDAESENIVQMAIDKARQDRTCIIIAHRLSTIQNADQIAVMEMGHVAEIGNHQSLMASKGSYYELQSSQINI